MPVVKQTLTSDFFQMPNAFAADLSLSPQEVCIMVYAVSKPSDWKFTREELCKAGRCSDSTLKGVIRSLKDKGYLSVQQTHANGRRGCSEAVYEFFQVPIKTVENKTVENKTSKNCTSFTRSIYSFNNTGITKKGNLIKRDNAQSTLTNERGTTDGGEFQDSGSGHEAALQKRAVHNL